MKRIMEVLLVAEVLCVVLHTATCVSPFADGPRPVDNISETVRVFHQAPYGTNVWQYHHRVRPGLPLPHNINFTLSEENRISFSLTGSTLYVARYPYLRRKVGEHYIVEIHGSTEGRLVLNIELHVVVSMKNFHTPVFTEEHYEADVYHFGEVGKEILRLNATDDDVEPYNHNVTYSVQNDPTQIVFVFPTNGSVVIGPGLARVTSSVVKLSFRAADQGAPPLSSKANLTLHVRDIPEVVNITATVIDHNTARLCWYRPRYGRINSYKLIYSPQRRPLARTEGTVSRGSRASVCRTLVNLEPYEVYTAEVRALANGIQGASSTISFLMDRDMCEDEPCGFGGKCLVIHREPGYTCACPDGTHGPSCPNPDPCDGPHCPVHDKAPPDCRCGSSQKNRQCTIYCRNLQRRNCLNGGSFVRRRNAWTCSCRKGFHGDRCESYNPCDENDQCQNGAICRNISSTQMQCLCREGYYGKFCERYDPCITIPCHNGGICRNTSDTSFICECIEGHYGDTCARLNPCYSAPCQNNGICRNISESRYTCSCRPGFHGSDCSSYNPCLQNPCEHEGMCNSVDGHFMCHCLPGYFGERCEHVNMCEVISPCGDNSITCRNLSDSTYHCVCSPDWSGINCTQSNPCAIRPCLHGGVCRRRHTDRTTSRYQCTCAPGYQGSRCELVDHCAMNPCLHRGTCRESSRGFTCSCLPGYYGERCENYNPCVRSACAHNSTCRNISETVYRCECHLHFFGERCENFNSCHSSPCVNGGRCRVVDGADFECSCISGYAGRRCEEYNPCASSPCRNQGTCYMDRSASGTRYTCDCPADFFGHRCEHRNHCNSGPCIKGNCSNTGNGNFHCDCPRGYFGAQCESTDPCASNPCENRGTCFREGNGRYTCNCAPGYNGTRCERRDPCFDTRCQNGGRCERTGYTQFRCQCPSQFQGPFCEEEVPCDFDGKRCLHDGYCDRHNGTFVCRCARGWSGFRCSDFDPCVQEDLCDNGGTCMKVTDGDVRCTCQPGFYGTHCESHTPCDRYLCENGATCVRSESGPLCYCPTGFTGKNCSHNVDECASQPCLNGGTCVDADAGFFCRCLDDFTGDTCEFTDICYKDTIYEAKGLFKWPGTKPDAEASIVCPRGSVSGGRATRYCRTTQPGFPARWDAPNTDACGVAGKNVSQVLEGLSAYINGNVTLTSPRDLHLLTRFLETSKQYVPSNERVCEGIVSVMNMVLDVPAELIHKSNTSTRLLGVLEDVTQILPINTTVTMIRSNLQITVKIITYNEHDSGAIYIPQGIGNVHIVLPGEIFQRDVSVNRMKFVYMTTGKLFQSSQWSGDYFVPGVVSASVGLNTYTDLTHCVKYTLANKKVSHNNRCVYWEKAGGQWLAEGIETLSYRGLRTTCCSDHLTYFSVIADAKMSAWSVVEEDLYITLTSAGGLGLAIVCLAAVLVTYSMFRSLNQEVLGQVIIQLSISHILLDIFTLVGFNHFQLGSGAMCTVTAVLRHYMAITALVWVAILGQLVYRTLAAGDLPVQRWFMLKRLILAWGVPVIPVVCVLGADVKAYSRNPENCFLASDNLHVYCSSYVLPGILLVITMLGLLALILHSLCESASDKRKQITINTCQVFGCLFLMVVVSTGFLFNYFSSLARLVDYATILYYTSFTLNGLAGLSVFLSFLLFRRDARGVWVARCCLTSAQGDRVSYRSSPEDSSSHTPVNRRDYSLVGSQQGAESRKRDQTSPGTRSVRSAREHRGCSRRTSRVSESSEYLDVYVPEVIGTSYAPPTPRAVSKQHHAASQGDISAAHAQGATANHSGANNHVSAYGSLGREYRSKDHVQSRRRSRDVSGSQHCGRHKSRHVSSSII